MWLGGGLLSLAGLAAVAVLVPDVSSRPARAAAADAARTVDARLHLLTIAYGLFGFGYIITATFIVDIVRRSPEAAPIEPLFWLALGLAAIPSVAAWVALGRLIGVVRAFALACAIEAAGVCASVAGTGVPALLGAAILLGGTFMGLTALGLIAARNMAPAAPRRAIAVLTAAFGLGQIAGPLVAGYGFDLTGSFYLPSLLAAGGLLVSACLALLAGLRQIA
jgi:hypothetical protein